MRKNTRKKAAMNLRALRMVFPHTGNNTSRKLTLVTIMGLWVAMELGAMFTQATPPVSMEYIRYLALWIIAREHGIELAGIKGGSGGNEDQ